MINTSQTYKQLFNERAIHDYRLLVDDVTYTHEDIKGSIVLQKNLFDKSTFTVGSFTIGVLKLKLTVPSDEIPHNASVVFSYRYNNGETQSEWIDKFKGNITRRTIHGDALTEIEVKDKASNYDKFLDYFGESLSKYPANTREVANLCASHLGLEIDNIEDVINLDIVEYPNENTMVEMLKEIATNSGGNWTIVGDKLRLVTTGNKLELTYPARSIKENALLSPISKVLIYYANLTAFESGTDTGSTLEADSKWGTQESADYVHSVVNGYEYKPLKVTSAYADPALELGDIVTIADKEVLMANVKWEFDGSATVDVEVPINGEINYDDPYSKMMQAQFDRKVTLGDSYQGVTISRDKGIEMLVSPDGSEDNAIGRYYADLYRGIAFQTRDNKDQEWQDWLYFDINKKTFRMKLVEEIKEEIKEIELTPGPQGPQGIPGKDGLDGKTYYTWVRYADDENGNGISNSPVGKTYIGLAFNKETETESNNPKDYKWSLLPQHLTVGGRNIMMNSGKGVYTTKGIAYGGTVVIEDGMESVKWELQRGIIAYISHENLIEDGVKYTLSYWAKSNYQFEDLSIYLNGENAGIKVTGAVTNDWKLFTTTFTGKNKNNAPIHLHMYPPKKADDHDFFLANWKLEKGDVATDWTPAPEDWENELLGVKEEVTINSTNLEMLPDSIMSQVMETYTSKSEMLEFEQQVSTQFTQTATDYEFLFSQVTEYIQTLDEETQAEFEEFRKYIRFVNGEIHLGNNQEPLELRIKNDRIAFLQNGKEVAFFSNNKFYVTDGHFINSLRLGGFEFRPRDNGSLSFGKVGE